MCFSAAASFSAAAVCGGIGAGTLWNAGRRDLLFAFVPVIFSAHQALEGFVWLTNAEGAGRCAGYSFVIVAFCLWPVYIPVAAWLSESDARRRKRMLPFLVLGVAVAALAVLVLCSGLKIGLAAHHIAYLPRRRYPLVFDYLYAASVAGPLFLSRNVYLRIFACLILTFFGVSATLFNPARYSVWCFFAAASSVVLFFYVRSRRCRPPSPGRPKTLDRTVLFL